MLGLLLFVPFVRWELRHDDPVIDVRMFASPSLWPVFVTAGLFGVSVLGAQAPLSTFARTDPAIYGYGLGATTGLTSVLIGAYVLSLTVGALLLPLVTRWISPRWALVGASLLVALGYLLFLPFHASYAEALTNMVIAGIGSGALVAALPAAAAAAAPSGQTGVATGLTNSVKTVGGSVASAVFGIALATHAAGAVQGTAGSFSGYLTVWTVCGVTALVAAIALLFVPKTAFGDPPQAGGSENRPLPPRRNGDGSPAVRRRGRPDEQGPSRRCSRAPRPPGWWQRSGHPSQAGHPSASLILALATSSESVPVSTTRSNCDSSAQSAE